MGVQLLDKTRKINKLLHNNSSSKVVFNDICEVLTEILDSNVLVISKKGKVLGGSKCEGVPYITELIEREIGKHVEHIVQSAISTLSYSELEAIIHIFDELDGAEGILVASKIADRVGITRSVIVNALRKFESAGVIESRSSGMKGTYIKVINDYVFTELDRIKAERTK